MEKEAHRQFIQYVDRMGATALVCLDTTLHIQRPVSFGRVSARTAGLSYKEVQVVIDQTREVCKGDLRLVALTCSLQAALHDLAVVAARRQEPVVRRVEEEHVALLRELGHEHVTPARHNAP